MIWKPICPNLSCRLVKEEPDGRPPLGLRLPQAVQVQLHARAAALGRRGRDVPHHGGQRHVLRHRAGQDDEDRAGVRHLHHLPAVGEDIVTFSLRILNCAGQSSNKPSL